MRDFASFANGVLEEYRIARATGRFLIPIAATGGAAEAIYNNILENPPPAGQIPALDLLKSLADPALSPVDILKRLKVVLDEVLKQ